MEELRKKLEQGLVPDDELRRLIRIQLAKRLQWGCKPTHQEQVAQVVELAKSLRHMSFGTQNVELDKQLYELPVSFHSLMLGKSQKLSCSYFEEKTVTLDEAEIAMLDLYCRRAQIADGQRVLDLGCGQGAVAVYLAQKYKNCHITAITNSVSQKDFVEERCRKLQLSNINVILADIVEHEMEATFDRIFVIEVFEHKKNFELLLRKISKWMAADGLLFLEHMCHKTLAYHQEPVDDEDWYIPYFFPSGMLIMPSASFFLYFQDDVSVVDHWILSGNNFAQSGEEWLKRLDKNMDKAKEILESFLGSKESAEKQINYYRGLCISAIETFGYGNGEEWMLSHVLFKKK